MNATEFAEALDRPLAETKPVEVQKLGYVREPGIIATSYSKFNTLYSCPRKFQLGEMEDNRFKEPSVYTAFGHAVGAGIQIYLQYAPQPLPKVELREFSFDVFAAPEEDAGIHVSEEAWKIANDKAMQRAVFATMQAWSHPNLWEVYDKAKDCTVEDSIWAVRMFAQHVGPDILQEWELAWVETRHGRKPAIELNFYVGIYERYSFQGHIDIVLRHRKTGKLAIWEIKTGGKEKLREDYENSYQTLGYNCILQAIGEITESQYSYEVHYICYHTKERTYKVMDFVKPASIRAEFIANLLLDINQIDVYIEHNLFPKRGNSCRSFSNTCRFYGTCDLVTRANEFDDSMYKTMARDECDFILDIDDLLRLQEVAITFEEQ